MKWRKTHPRLDHGFIRIRSLIKQMKEPLREMNKKIRLHKRLIEIKKSEGDLLTAEGMRKWIQELRDEKE